ncbi:MAG TPA: hypothetical protein VM097_12185 [Mycobacteriales bacterium]|nr:hypothetical protein [Mycobacteriales bacterium]
MRKALLAGTTLLAAAGFALTGSPVEATSVTFSLTGGSLAVTQPSATATLTGGGVGALAGTALTGALGSTTVNDTRGGVTGWTSTITQSAVFTNGTTTIPVGNTKAWVAGAIVPTGTAVVSAGTRISQATGMALLGTAQNFVTATAVVGVNSATFNPQIAITLPGDATAGDYTGTITQTVS